MITPDIAIMSVEAEITYGKSMEPDDGWVQILNQRWDKNIVMEEDDGRIESKEEEPLLAILLKFPELFKITNRDLSAILESWEELLEIAKRGSSSLAPSFCSSPTPVTGWAKRASPGIVGLHAAWSLVCDPSTYSAPPDEGLRSSVFVAIGSRVVLLQPTSRERDPIDGDDCFIARAPVVFSLAAEPEGQATERAQSLCFLTYWPKIPNYHTYQIAPREANVTTNEIEEQVSQCWHPARSSASTGLSEASLEGARSQRKGS
ncbi:hypothetical protein VNO77_37555 [Canavalia gladiata]|uniref:Sucrose phosphatase-like domain-containing protein n=1 Tax=Canavalia gladiata TaxID=3824 RepID=A0AAN9K8Y8_CANGL